MMVARNKKPKKPLPGKPSGKLGCYEVWAVVSAFASGTATVVFGIVNALANQNSMDTLWNSQTTGGLIGVIIVTIFTLFKKRSDNNIKKS